MRRYPHHRWYAAPVTAGICLALAACGGSSDQTASPVKTGGQATAGPGQSDDTSGKQGNTKPCDLLTVDELKAATGFTAQAGTAAVSDVEGESGCEWVVEDGNPGKATVSVDVLPAGLYPGLAPSAAVKVSGVGDEALWASGLWTLYVHTAQQDFSVQVATLKVKQQPTAQALALKVLARL